MCPPYSVNGNVNFNLSRSLAAEIDNPALLTIENNAYNLETVHNDHKTRTEHQLVTMVGHSACVVTSGLERHLMLKSCDTYKQRV